MAGFQGEAKINDEYRIGIDGDGDAGGDGASETGRRFRGVLTLIDVASDRAPAGARGHRVILSRAAAEEGLASLLGMAIDYAPTLDRHDARRKVGVITRAEIIGRKVELGGHLFAKDFPEIVQEIGKSGRGLLRQWRENGHGAGYVV